MDVTPTIELLPHNQKLYNDIVEQISAGERSIFYSEATGLGKSFIFMQLVYDYFVGKRIMYIVPKIAIWENIVHYEEFNDLPADVTMSTFAAFNTYDSNDKLYEQFDMVIVDECHHMISDIQGANVGLFLNDIVSSGRYAFGMTATPKHQGKYVDEIFFKVSCFGYDVFEAVKLGLLPKIDIAVADIDTSKITPEQRARFRVSSTKSVLEQIIEERPDITHWLAYFSRKRDLLDSESDIRRLFPDFTILKLYYGYGNPIEVIRQFEEYDGKVVLLSVSMLLEGMHLDNVGGVLLYRNVTRTNTYFQIYGRLCKIKVSRTPLLVDITNSVYNISDFSMFKSCRSRCKNTVYHKRDLFDIESDSYRYVELSDEVNPFKVKEYRDIVWTSLRSLELVLRKGNGSIRRYLKSHDGSDVEDYIDSILGDMTLDLYLDSKRKKSYEITIAGTVYVYTSVKDLVTQIGRDSYGIESIRLNSYISIIEWEYEHGFVIGGKYRNIDITSINTLSNALNINRNFIKTFMSREDVSVVECIDMYLDSNMWYKGVPLLLGIDYIRSITGSGRNSIMNKYNRIGSMRKLIDYYTPDDTIYRGIKIGTGVTYQDIGEQLGIKGSEVGQFIIKNKCGIKECIDYFLCNESENEIIKTYINDPHRMKIYSELIPGKTRMWYYAQCKRNGSPLVRQPPFSQEENLFIDMSKESGMSWSEIVKGLNNMQYNIENNIIRTINCTSVHYNRRKRGKVNDSYN